MLRHLTRYLADNALRPVSLLELRAAWAGTMAAPTTSAGPLVRMIGRRDGTVA